MSAERKLLFYAIMWAGTALLVLGAIELLLPRFAPAQPQISRHRWGSRPHTFLPGVVQHAFSENYDVRFRTNALGFNDREHALAKPHGTFRVLLLGDSFVEGMQVPPEHHLARLLEARAARERGALEVVAMGISGWGQAHELAAYEAVGRGLAPDLVVAFFCPNDVWNNAVGAEGEDGPPIYTLDAGGSVVDNLSGVPERAPLPDEYRKHERQPRFPGLRIARRMLRETLRGATGEARGAARAAALNELPPVQRPEGLRGPRGVRPEQQLLFEAIVAEMERRIVERDGHALVSVVVSGNLLHEPKRGYERLKAWVAETFAREGVDTLDLDAAFRERARREQQMPHWENDAHWNEVGHLWAADALYDWLELAHR